MAVVTKYNIPLFTFADIINSLRDVFLRTQDGSSSVGTVTKDDELAFLINKCYVLLENYQWSWNWRRANSAATGRITTVSGTSAYTLPVLAREKKPLIWISDGTNPKLDEVLTPQEYRDKTYHRSGSNGTPREFSYIERYTTARTYTTGTLSGTSGEYELTGVGTSWLLNLCPGSIITPAGYGSTVTVATVQSDTKVILTAALTTDITAPTTYSASTSYPLNQIDLNPIPAGVTNYEFLYCRKFHPLIAGTDEPLLPLNDRWVLVDGAYSLYKWTHNKAILSGISPETKVIDKEAFLMSPATVQKFFNQYVAKLLADDKKLVGTARIKQKFKRGY